MAQINAHKSIAKRGKGLSVYLSIVTISYNQVQYLEECITSVIRQLTDDMEYIVIDAGSTDGSRELLRRYEGQITTLVFQSDKGAADGLNKGLGLSRGTIFYYLNSDDVVAQGSLQYALSYFKNHNSTDVLYGNGVIIDGDGRYVRRAFSSPYFNAKLYALGVSVIVQQSAFIRKAILVASGGFNIENKTSWDGEAFFEISLRGGNFRRVWKDLGFFRIYPTSISGSNRFRDLYEQDRMRIRSRVGIRENGKTRLKVLLLRLLFRILDIRRIVAQRMLPA